MYCMNCHQEIPSSSARFCPKCGTEIATAPLRTTAAVPATAPSPAFTSHAAAASAALRPAAATAKAAAAATASTVAAGASVAATKAASAASAAAKKTVKILKCFRKDIAASVLSVALAVIGGIFALVAAFNMFQPCLSVEGPLGEAQLGITNLFDTISAIAHSGAGDAVAGGASWIFQQLPQEYQGLMLVALILTILWALTPLFIIGHLVFSQNIDKITTWLIVAFILSLILAGVVGSLESNAILNIKIADSIGIVLGSSLLGAIALGLSEAFDQTKKEAE